jgi:SAM-dependent methyltransferase
MTRDERPWYRDLFDSGDYTRFWLGGDKPFITPELTQLQVDFILKTLDLAPGAAILDLCCGFGRHSIGLARAGYRVTGIDASAGQLETAQQAGAEAGVDVDWVQADMRDIPERLFGQMDAAINMFTAFGYLESDDEDQKVLNAVGRALKPGGLFLIDFINREATIRRFQEKDWERRGEWLLLHDRRYDFDGGRVRDGLIIVAPDGTERKTGIVLRFYTLAELLRMMAEAGLHFRQAWGDFEGGDLTLDSRRCIVLAEKR